MFKFGDVLYNKIETKPIGSGGNARVFKAKSASGNIVALKELKTGGRFFNKKKERFNLEIKIVKEIQNELIGIIPIIDFALPDEKGKYWYTMPIAQPINEKLPDEASLEEIAKCIIQLANVMAKIHDRDIVHRDIKPSNIYWYDGNYCFGDFGLVDYPDKADLTTTRESVGPRNTIAPEMKNDAKNSDGKKADVYSLAKTLWMLLTKSRYGFEGTYDESSNMMGLSEFYPDQHLVELNFLLYDSTREEPSLRPTMKEFSNRLEEWLSVRSDFEKSNLSQWRYIQNKLFKDYIPDTAVWTDIKDIVNVLNLLGSMPSLNHMFIPSGGGLDLNKASLSYEDGCIEIDAMEKYVLKPRRLIVENISKDYIWSYFRLELDELEPIFSEEINLGYERLTDDLSGNYLPWLSGNYGYYEDGTPLPSNYKIISRYIRGNFVMFSKASIYNGIPGTYDGRHNKFTSKEFRKYIEFLRIAYLKVPKATFFDMVNKDPFKMEVKEIDDSKQNEIRRKVELERIFKNYISEHIGNYNFQSLFLTSHSIDGNIGFVFKYIERGDNFWERKELYLTKDGKFKSNIPKNEDDLYILFSEEDAMKFVNQFNQFIKKECQNNGIEHIKDLQILAVEGKRIGPPEHLFTKDELKEILINGNDHVNNTLVINNKGYLELLEDHRFNDFEFIKYPVRHEGFNAFNNYVGKYSKLYHFEETYISSLQGWLMYLQRGGTVYLDYVRENREEELLLKEILTFYKTE